MAFTSVKYEWTMRHYDIGGDPVEANYTGYSDLGETHVIGHATGRTIQLALNGVDSLSFGIYLDDPMAALIEPTQSVIKIWRKITDTSTNTVIYEDPSGNPVFGGIVSGVNYDGAQNIASVTVQSPLWRLQSRFHILNHYFKLDPDTGLDYKQSALMWKLISLINGAFGSDSFTGITKGTFDWASEPSIAPYFVAKGSNTWSNIFDDIMNRVAGSDIWPSYRHTDGSPTIMRFDTAEVRGRSLATEFKYHTGSGDNCANVTKEFQAIPGEFANYVWAVGQGGPNSGRIAMAEDNTASNYGYNKVGIYMRRVDRSEIKLVSALQPIADAELAQSKWPKYAFSVEVSPAGGIFYGEGDDGDYAIGDRIALTATKGALNEIAALLRIYQCSLSMSDNNIETVNPLLSLDFKAKFPT